jgi:hypothetical protein
MSAPTVETHRMHSETGLHNRGEIALYAVQQDHYLTAKQTEPSHFTSPVLMRSSVLEVSFMPRRKVR